MRMTTQNSQGFALLEAMAAIFVALVGIFSALQMFDYGVRKLKVEEESRVALRLLQNELEVLRTQPFDALASTPNDEWLGKHDDLEWLMNAKTRLAVETPVNAPDGLLKVTVAVRWRSEFGRPIERELSTMIARGNSP